MQVQLHFAVFEHTCKEKVLAGTTLNHCSRLNTVNYQLALLISYYDTVTRSISVIDKILLRNCSGIRAFAARSRSAQWRQSTIVRRDCGDDAPNKSSDKPARLRQSRTPNTPTKTRRALPLAKQLPLPYGCYYAERDQLFEFEIRI